MKFLIFFILAVPNVTLAEVYGFETVNRNTYSSVKTQSEITNLPPVMSQDTLGICYAYAASTLLTAENCRLTGNRNCSQIKQNGIFSPLGLAPYGRVSGEDISSKGSGGDDLPGGNITNALIEVSQRTGMGPSEECLSLDKILSHVGGAKEASQMQLDVWKKLSGLYAKSKSIPKGCDSCAADFYATAKDEIEKSFDVKVTNESLLKAFAEDTYAKFFDRLFTPPACMRMGKALAFEGYGKESVEYYPRTKKGNYNEALEKVKIVLQTGRPLGLSNLCLDKNPSERKCDNPHGLVIAGYRKICQGNSETNCKDVLKVVNSWGDSWQRRNDDGWVDARTLLDRTYYMEGTLTWLTDKK